MGGEFHRQVRLVRSGTLHVTSQGGEVEMVIRNRAKGKSTKGKELSFEGIVYPEGALESLRPLLREAFAGVNDEESFWAEIDAKATMTLEAACNKLRKAGIGHVQAARALILTDPITHQSKTWNDIGETEVSAAISKVAALIRPYYQNVKRK